ncbi:MAG: glycosyltransferase family 2 protein [Cyclobacteriaceae bacterium]
MLSGKKVVVILPAYNAEKTLEKTINDVPTGVVDEFILVDDYSTDGTFELAQSLGIKSFRHDRNKGYGGNQKTCYAEALKLDPDVVIMLHPDYQYEPKLIPAMAGMIISGVYDVVMASRILGRGALKGGMPLYKYVANRFLTLVENWLLGLKLSEYHSGYRAFSAKALRGIDLSQNSDDFVFDNQMLAQLKFKNFAFGEISCPTKYFPEASSINLKRSITYGLGVLGTAIQYRLQKMGVAKFRYFG